MTLTNIDEFTQNAGSISEDNSNEIQIKVKEISFFVTVTIPYDDEKDGEENFEIPFEALKEDKNRRIYFYTRNECDSCAYYEYGKFLFVTHMLPDSDFYKTEKQLFTEEEIRESVPIYLDGVKGIETYESFRIYF